MAPTPIRVRGKGRKAKWNPPKELSRPAKRQKKAGRSEKLTVECLPLEILERIFHHSKNLNFPRSSLLIGRALSHPSFLHELIIDAFEPTWDNWYGMGRREVSSYHGWRHDVVRYGGDADYQTQVLNCSWLTLGHIFEAQRRWYNRAGSLVAYRTPIEQTTSHFGVHYASYGIIAGNLAHGTWFEFAGNGHNTVVPRFPAAADILLDIHPYIRIPDRLLAGGSLPARDVQLLLWLVLNGARLHQNQTWEAALNSFRDIAATPDFDMFPDYELLPMTLVLYGQLGLFSMDGFVHWYEFVAKTAAPRSKFLQAFCRVFIRFGPSEMRMPVQRTS